MNVIQLRAPGGPEVLELVEKPLPAPGAGEVRVKAQAIGVNSADMLIRRGVYNWMPPLPAVPGNEMAGVIDAVGRDVKGLRVGQKVLVSSRDLAQRGGCYAQAICVPADVDLFGELRRRLGKSLGVRCYSIHTLDEQPELRRALTQRAIDLMAAGKLKPPPATLFPLADAAVHTR